MKLNGKSSPLLVVLSGSGCGAISLKKKKKKQRERERERQRQRNGQRGRRGRINKQSISVVDSRN